VAESSSAPSTVAGAKRVEKPRRLKWRHHLAAVLIFAGLRAVSSTWRIRLLDTHGVVCPSRGPFIGCLWHNRLALAMPVWERFLKHHIRSAGLVALISASHDGGVLARTLRYFDVEAVRGSSSRRGPQALLELTSWTDRNYVIAITPDGPRGPRYEIHDGILALAQLSGLPIVPFSGCIHWKLSLKSWDRFQIPLPFSRCDVSVGEPLVVPRDATEEQRASLRTELRNRMMAVTKGD
jgi:lysophospholipid acyltransferase (LPLAT)-like uncharacterized protein